MPSSLGSIIGSSERLLGVMILLPPTPAFGNKQLMSNFSMKQKPTGILQAIAQVNRIKSEISYAKVMRQNHFAQQHGMHEPTNFACFIYN